MTTGTQGPAPVRELTQAIREKQVRPVYMAIADLTDDRVVAVEALARWYRPTGEVVPPDAFIPPAEESELIVDLDLAVAAQALGDLARWQQTDPTLRLTLNLSGRHLERAESVDRLLDLVARAGVDPTTVILELTETYRPADAEHASELAGRLRRSCSLWLDDFGSGLANLGDLLRLPVDGLKIDRPFARRLGEPATDAVVAATSTLAAELGLVVVIEGIEEPAQAVRARELGCHLGQGFLYSRGLTADQVPHLRRR